MSKIVIILMVLATLFAIYWWVIRPWMAKPQKYEGPAKI